MIKIPDDIIREAARGNMDAFEKIYRMSSGFVYNLAYRITSSRDAAQEVTQDVFLKIYQNIKGFQFRASFMTWVYRIATNTAINAYRKGIKTTRQTQQYHDELHYVSAPGPSDEPFIKDEQRHILENLLSRLNPDQRVCIVLREIQGLNYKEISRVLKININTVRSRLRRARQALLALRKKEVVSNGL
jgi:RNA polymerase sigma-70 factor (ECF subfamily)